MGCYAVRPYSVRPHMNTIFALVNPEDEEWVRLVGRYIMNMGAVEATTRLLIAVCEKNDRAVAMMADLPSRLGYLRKRFPRQPQDRHSWAMNVLAGATKHVAFRNVVAHSPLQAFVENALIEPAEPTGVVLEHQASSFLRRPARMRAASESLAQSAVSSELPRAASQWSKRTIDSRRPQ